MVKTDYEPFYKEVSEELGIQEDLVKGAYLSFWKFIKSTIEALQLKDDLTKEEFDKLKTNFNVTSLGKLSCTYDKYLAVKRRYAKIKKMREIKDGRV